jgi:hypothetical protein
MLADYAGKHGKMIERIPPYGGEAGGRTIRTSTREMQNLSRRKADGLP